MKYSRQKEIIEKAVKNNPIHPTADDIYSLLKPENPNLSLGTVYRNLKQLAECGSIKKVGTFNGSQRFDGDLEEHSHVVCNRCGKIFDIKSPVIQMDTNRLEQITEAVKTQTGIDVHTFELILKGTCTNCKKAKGC